MARFPRLCGVGWVLLSLFGTGNEGRTTPLVPIPVGDQGSYALSVQNHAVHPVEVRLVPAGGEAPIQRVAGYQAVDFTVQCLDSTGGAAPKLSVEIEDRLMPMSIPPISFPKGAPAIWITSNRSSRAALESVVSNAIGIETFVLLAVSPKEVPTTFAALRFAPLLLVSAADYAALAPRSRAALRGAVVAGATAVISTGEGDVPAGLLKNLTPIELGEAVRSGPVLRAALPDAAACRQLRLTGQSPDDPRAYPLVEADGQPVVAESRLGLGRVRLLSVRFRDLKAGRVAEVAFDAQEDALGQVTSWLGKLPPLADREASAFDPLIWWGLLGIVLIAVAARWLPKLALASAAPALVAALVLPPVGVPETVDAVYALYVPFKGGALVVGAFDLSLRMGGGRALAAGTHPASIEKASPGGACMVAAGDSLQYWALAGDPNERRRISFYAIVEEVPRTGAVKRTLPSWPSGLLAGARLAKTEGPIELPLLAESADHFGWVVQPSPPEIPGSLRLEPP